MHLKENEIIDIVLKLGLLIISVIILNFISIYIAFIFLLISNIILFYIFFEDYMGYLILVLIFGFFYWQSEIDYQNAKQKNNYRSIEINKNTHSRYKSKVNYKNRTFQENNIRNTSEKYNNDNNYTFDVENKSNYKSKQQNNKRRVGAICKDGTYSSATGSGACSHHGGVAYWIYE